MFPRHYSLEMPQVESTAHPLLPAHPHDHLESSLPPFIPPYNYCSYPQLFLLGHSHSTPMTVLFQNALYVGNTFNGILYGE